MSVADYEVILKKIRKHPIQEIKLMGMGEPYLHPRFSEICALTRKYFPDAFIISATNCQYKLNENFKDSLQHIDLLYLSIDGWGELYEKYRPPSKWSVLLKFLNDLKDIDRGRAKLAINYTLNPENIFDVVKMPGLIEQYNLDELRINLVQNWSEEESDAELISGFTSDHIQFLRENFSEQIKGKAVWDFNDCFWVQNGLYVTCTGDIKICCMNTSTAPIGNLIKDPAVSLSWGNKRFQAIKHGCETNNPETHCANCSYKELVPILSSIL